jgi:two-component system chemotaxis family response regulator WspR
MDDFADIDLDESLPTKPAMVMLVDDQPMVAEAMRRVVASAQDLDFHYCSDPADALLTAERIGPKVILLDLVMPSIDGMTLLAQMRANPKIRSVPIIMLSTREEGRIKEQAFAAGANDYLIKWPESIELLARLRYHAHAYLNSLQRDAAFRALRESQRKLAEMNVQLQRLASLDGLTGIANRRTFGERFEEEWLRARRDGSSLAIVLLDVDLFKGYNDSYGHQAGDECLKAVAHAIESSLRRPADFCARYGGEEFVMLLPQTTLEGAGVIAEAVRAKIESLQMAHDSSSIAGHVTASAGFAAVTPSRSNSADELLELADKALYLAKRSGRNRASAMQRD